MSFIRPHSGALLLNFSLFLMGGSLQQFNLLRLSLSSASSSLSSSPVSGPPARQLQPSSLSSRLGTLSFLPLLSRTDLHLSRFSSADHSIICEYPSPQWSVYHHSNRKEVLAPPSHLTSVLQLSHISDGTVPYLLRCVQDQLPSTSSSSQTKLLI